MLTKLGREDEARDAYGTGVGQDEKFGHSGMAEDLRLSLGFSSAGRSRGGSSGVRI